MIPTKLIRDAFHRLSEVKDKTYNKLCLLIVYPLLKGKEQIAKNGDGDANIQIVRRCSFSIDDKSECLVLLYKIR